MVNNNGTAGFEQFLNGLGKMEKDLTKMSSRLNAEVMGNFEKIMNQQIYEGEKKMKINKKSATVSLAKDGSVKIVFDNPGDGKSFFEGKK